jgi:endonuclease/exonuclease/phosphatase family metal-dependent hydrolase
MGRRRGGALAVLVAGGSALIATPLLMVMVLMGGTAELAATCAPGPGTVVLAAGTSGGQLDQDQLTTASAVILEGYRLAVPRKALGGALAVAHQESRFRVYANDGIGVDLRPDQAGIERSLLLPHDAVGSDHGSLGVFQQQWPSWGSMPELMDPATSARKFYLRLLDVPGWEHLSVTEAGQAVQRSAHPDAYADDEPLAEELLDGVPPGGSVEATGSSLGDLGLTTCAEDFGGAGTVTFPLPAGSGYTDAHNWGAVGAAWSKGHTGTDFSVACGTPVLAATGGTVVVRTDQPWSGRWLVQVTTGVGRLTTWYGHLQALLVREGQSVRAGEPLGEVGAEGNATGCHLHFEVHPRGGTIYEDGVDPTAWLQDNIGTHPGQEPPTPSGPGFVIATFNVLGDSHTAPGGNKAGWASSRERMRLTVDLLHRHDVDVLGLQELQPPQARALRSMAGGDYADYHPPGETSANSIAWRRARWDLVSAESVAVPYFDGRVRRMPVVRLRDRDTDLDSIFVNVHNPASTHDHPRQGAHRAEAVRREVALVRLLRDRHGVPVFLVGDLNDRRDAFCRLTDDSLMVASAGGASDDGRCHPPPDAGIDWIFGTTGTRFVDHTRVRDETVRAASDHPLVLARVVGASGLR